NKEYKSWSSRCNKGDLSSSLKHFGEYYLRQIDVNTKASYNEKDLQLLLSYFGSLLNVVIGYLYKRTADSEFNFFPRWKYSQIDSKKQLEKFSILNLVHIMFLNLELPTDFQNEWNILFSTSIHGESFSRY
ncbi:hypothetical protein, partial [Micromonospora noduli]|uniref:hypothetical protein n=1 Tax=Micromonospora noduli TaxID=709876 RepID=UPI001475D364